jgi:uncharacterized alkaline shock family protein YloU
MLSGQEAGRVVEHRGARQAVRAAHGGRVAGDQSAPGPRAREGKEWPGHRREASEACSSVGTIEALYRDEETESPEWAAVRTGLFGTKQTFVRITQAQPSGEQVRVPVTKEQIKDAPRIDPEGEQATGRPARGGLTMAEQTGATARDVAGRGAPGGPGGDDLRSERGSTSIADAVVTKVAGIAAREVGGVHELGGGVARSAIGDVAQRVGVTDERSQGVSVEVGEREAAVDLTLVIEYGESIPQVSEAVRNNVIKRVEGITGLSVTEVNVAVNDLWFPGDEQPEQQRVE